MKHITADTYLFVDNDEHVHFYDITDLREMFNREYKYREHDDLTFDLWLCENADADTLLMPKYFPIYFDLDNNNQTFYHDYQQRTVFRLGKLLHLMYCNLDDMALDGDSAYNAEWTISFNSKSREVSQTATFSWGAEEFEVMERMVAELICVATR